jgi:hypothetical protein
MPDSRMSLDSILTPQSEEFLSDPFAAKRSLPIRPGMHRSSTPRPDPWDLPYPLTMRSQSTYSTYSVYSNASAHSNASSQDSNSMIPPLLQNPGLSRSDSSDSGYSHSLSPVTPESSSPDMTSAAAAASGYPAAARCDEIAAGVALTSMRNMTPHSTPFTSPIILPPAESPRRSASPRTPRDANGNRLYPCPLASIYRCDQHFSTSGHARRHSRIHTGERASECPECGQRFSRQDNMQQHRRTHRNGRDSRRSKGSKGERHLSVA